MDENYYCARAKHFTCEPVVCYNEPMDISTFDFTIISMAGLIVFAAAFFGGIVDSVCGGGGLIIVPSLMAIGMPPHMVVGTNQCGAIIGCWASFAEYAKAGKIDMKTGRLALPFALAGAFIGSRLNLVIDEKYLQILMIVLVPVLAFISIVKRDVGEEDRSGELSKARKIAGAAGIGLLVSAYHAFYGPASGIFYLMGFAYILKFDAVRANGLGRFMLACIDLISSTVYAIWGCICWKAVAVYTVSYMAGSIIGSRIAISKGSKAIRPLYYCVLAGLMIKLVIDLL